MRLAFITAGAAGMYCGSCMHDNTLASALIKLGHEALLIPTFTPIRTDEADVTTDRVYFGGVNVYLQNCSFLFRWTPRWFDRAFDAKRLLRFISRWAVSTRTEDMGDLTLSMLRGIRGRQAKEVDKLANHLEHDLKPDRVMLTNMLLSGMVPEIKRRLQVPIWGVLQGDDIFLEGLRPADRYEAIRLIRDNARWIEGYIVTSESYADFMAEYLHLDRDKMHVVHPGLKLDGHGGEADSRPDSPVTIGYFARICPEKGFHQLIDAYIQLRQRRDLPPTRLLLSGWLGNQRKQYFADSMSRLADAGLSDEVVYQDCPTLREKVAFIRQLDIMSVPTVYHEPKGLYILEAWANGVPVVQPRHGSFPELIESTGGGLLVDPDSTTALAEGLAELVLDRERRHEMGRRGLAGVRRHFTAEVMAKHTLEVLQGYALTRV